MRWWPFGRKAAPYTVEDLLRDMYGTVASAAGIDVTTKVALEATTALACARVIAEGLSQVPFRLMRNAGGRREPATDHPLFDLFDSAPNEWMTSVELLDTIGLHLVFCGNAYVWTNRVLGEVKELLIFDPRDVRVERKGWQTQYSVNLPDGGGQQRIPNDEMWHLRGPTWNGWMGLDGVKLARQAIGLALVTERHGSKVFAKGLQLDGFFSTDATLTQEQRAKMRESLLAAHSGEHAQRIAVLSNGVKFQAMSGNNEDAQFLETRRFQVEEVCRAFRVMPLMVGYSDKTATYASAEQMFIAHVTHTLGPWYRRVEKSAAVSLLTREDRDSGLYFKFFAQGLLRGAVKDRGEYYRSMYGIGAMCPNEIREFEDMNPYEGGDQYRVPMNTEDPNNPKVDPTDDASTADPAKKPDA